MRIRYNFAYSHALFNMYLKNLAVTVLLLGLAACNWSGTTADSLPAVPTTPATLTPLPTQVTETPIPTPLPARLLTICLYREPRSLFFYDAVSTSEQSVLAAIYDGPIDIENYTARPVILEKMPSLSDGDAVLQAVEVGTGDLIVDGNGNLANIGDGVLYRPSGCTEQACTQTYSGTDPVQMDQLILHFKLLPDLLWSDGTPLTASDSVYSYEVAKSLYPSALPEQVKYVASYKTLDDLTVEWLGVPGFMDGQYQTKFFSPLPQHAWANIPVDELSANEVSSRMPLGWGAYVIDDWVTGDHISLHANPLYFRAEQGLPYFDNLVYRFVNNSSEAQSALQAGECDLVEQSTGLEPQTAALLQQQEEGLLLLAFQSNTAWDLLQFDIHPLSAERPAFFAGREVRQAVAMCIDRQALVEQLSAGQMQIADLYVPSLHPLYNPNAVQYHLDPQAASDMLAKAGWLDTDADPSTPRIAQGVQGIADGTPFTVQYLVSDEEERQSAAKMVQADLQRCGIQVEIISQSAEEYLAPGPDGPVFGRQFDLAQFAWIASVEPPCSLYLTSEIPGPYPDYLKGWGGVNASGYSNSQYDQACLDGLHTLADMPQHTEKHTEAQAIFAEDLPALPLYWHYGVVMGRPDMCGLPTEAVSENIFSDLELFNYGEDCP
jgi:peptide/nickel transport system substrate-binding protein